jgi:membrane associated rhomboid family serine protease
MRPYRSPVSMSFGPGPMTPGVKLILIANVVMFVVTMAAPALIVGLLGLSPQDVFERGLLWQVASYLFVHSPGAIGHILFNMLAVWMFGVELERRWGTPFFAKYYFVCGLGAAVCTLVASLLPLGGANQLYYTTTIGASGAVYGLLMAWALIFPHREILFMFLFPLKARVFVAIIGAIAFFQAMGSGGGPVAAITHLGGLVIGWIYLSGPRTLWLELQRQLARRRMDRLRRRFNVHQGGKDYWTH